MLIGVAVTSCVDYAAIARELNHELERRRVMSYQAIELRRQALDDQQQSMDAVLAAASHISATSLQQGAAVAHVVFNSTRETIASRLADFEQMRHELNTALDAAQRDKLV